jgi:Ca2+-binding RTX toxin-like protein
MFGAVRVRRVWLAAAVLALGGAGAMVLPSAASATPGDTCQGLPVTNPFIGTDGPDYVYGTAANEVVNLRGGNDVYIDQGGADVVCLGSGNDTFTNVGGALTGDDQVYGEAGNDGISSSNGTDSLFGGDGNDSLSGDFGTQYLMGGPGDDVLSGGPGYQSGNGGTGLDRCQFTVEFQSNCEAQF